MKVEENITQIVLNHLGGMINELELDMDFRDLGIDSISFIEIISELEDYYNIEFPMEKLIMQNLSTTRNLIKTVEELLCRC